MLNCLAASVGHAAVVGVLIKAGADVRRASPAYYSIQHSDGTQKSDFDPSPDFSLHHSIDKTVRSYATKTCCGCGN